MGLNIDKISDSFTKEIKNRYKNTTKVDNYNILQFSKANYISLHIFIVKTQVPNVFFLLHNPLDNN